MNTDSSSDDEEGQVADLEQKILIRKKIPTLFGFVSLPVYMVLMYLFVIVFGALHCALVLQATFKIQSGFIVTVFFGLLGPISIFHWIITILFSLLGAHALFSRNKDYMQSAYQFRQWTRVSRYYMLSVVVTSTQFMYGCYMFVQALSLHNLVVRELEIKGLSVSSKKRQFYELLAKWHDELAYSNANSALQYPLNILYSTANHWGYFLPLAVMLPWALIAIGHKAQIMYFNWKFYSTGLQID